MKREEFTEKCRLAGLEPFNLYKEAFSANIPNNNAFHLVWFPDSRVIHSCYLSAYEDFPDTDFDRAIKHLYYWFLTGRCPIAKYFVLEMEK